VPAELFGVNRWSCYALPSQLEWPHLHVISVLSAMPSQWALQYFAFSGGMQLHAAFAHFLGVLAMISPWMYPLDGDERGPTASTMPELRQRIAGSFLVGFCQISVEIQVETAL
jgi:hypothetical protein